MITAQVFTFFCFAADIVSASSVPSASAMSVGSALGTGSALVWLLARTLPDRERTLRETARAHREGLRDLATAIDGLKDGMVAQMSAGNGELLNLVAVLANLDPKKVARWEQRQSNKE